MKYYIHVLELIFEYETNVEFILKSFICQIIKVFIIYLAYDLINFTH